MDNCHQLHPDLVNLIGQLRNIEEQLHAHRSDVWDNQLSLYPAPGNHDAGDSVFDKRGVLGEVKRVFLPRLTSGKENRGEQIGLVFYWLGSVAAICLISYSIIGAIVIVYSGSFDDISVDRITFLFSIASAFFIAGRTLLFILGNRWHRDFRKWHITEVPPASGDFRFRGLNGHPSSSR